MGMPDEIEEAVNDVSFIILIPHSTTFLEKLLTFFRSFCTFLGTYSVHMKGNYKASPKESHVRASNVAPPLNIPIVSFMDHKDSLKLRNPSPAFFV